MFGPYDKKFDKNKNGIMEDDEKLEEQAYIRYLAEKDDEGEEDASIVYLIHGRMIGYYINTDTLEVVRGKKIPESFYEYWTFIREDGRWVLNEIQQKDEVDVHEL